VYDMPVEMASVPRRPRIGNSTRYPARSAPGTPITLKMTCLKIGQDISVRISRVRKVLNRHFDR